MSTPHFTTGDVANAGEVPKIMSIFDFSAEALGQLRTWLEQNPPAISVASLIGYQANTQSSRVHLSADTAVATGTTRTVITWDVKNFDYGGLWTTSQLACRLAGKYVCGTSISWAANTTGDRYAALRLNGDSSKEIAADARAAASSVSFATDQNVSALLDLAVGDYLEVVVAQSSGGSLNVTGGTSARSFFWMARVGA